MSLGAVNPFDASPLPALPPGSSPAAIRDALIDEEREAFKYAYQQALTEASTTLDLSRDLDVLRNYHRIAWLTQQQGPQAHRRMPADAGGCWTRHRRSCGPARTRTRCPSRTSGT